MFRAYRYILREHIAPFFFSFIIITLLFVLDFMLSIVDSIFNKGLSIKDVLTLFILNMAWMVALSFPMAVLISALIAYGRMAGDNEIIALKASGLHPLKIIAPSIIASLIMGAGLVWFNDRVLPEANHKAAALIADIAARKPVSFIEEGYVIEDFPGYRLLIGRVNALTGNLQDVRIYHNESDQQTLTFAKRGKLSYLNGSDIIKLTLFDGESHQEGGTSSDDYFRTIFKEQSVYLDNKQVTPQNNSDVMRGDREMSIKMMQEKVRGFEDDVVREKKEIVGIMKESRTITVDSFSSKQPSVNFPFSKLSYSAHQNRYNDERRREMQLERHQFYLNNALSQINKYNVEIHKKFSIPVACLVFVLIGAPLGIMARTGGLGAGAVYSIAFFVIYWIGLIGGESLADNMLVPAWVAMWSPNIIIGGVGIWLLVRMVRERDYSASLWVEYFIKRFKKKSTTDNVK